MSVSDDASKVYQELRRLAFEDPLAAKRKVLELLGGDRAEFDTVLSLASEPGDSRVRLVIARALQQKADHGQLTDILNQWQEQETDEFASQAIEDALAGAQGKSRLKKVSAETTDLAITFRYLSSRLRHRILNVVPRIGLSIDELRDAIRQSGGEQVAADVLPSLDDLKASLRRLEQAVNFDGDEVYFALARISLPQWLKNQSRIFQTEFGSAAISINFDDEEQYYVKASPYLLDVIFTNLWINSKQEVGEGCEIALEGRSLGRKIQVTIIDNGPGLRESDTERAFTFPYSTKSTEERGRGHLEVDEAIRRLQGTAKVQSAGRYGYRVVLKFPRSEQ